MATTQAAGKFWVLLYARIWPHLVFDIEKTFLQMTTLGRFGNNAQGIISFSINCRAQ